MCSTLSRIINLIKLAKILFPSFFLLTPLITGCFGPAAMLIEGSKWSPTVVEFCILDSLYGSCAVTHSLSSPHLCFKIITISSLLLRTQICSSRKSKDEKGKKEDNSTILYFIFSEKMLEFVYKRMTYSSCWMQQWVVCPLRGTDELTPIMLPQRHVTVDLQHWRTV